MSKRTIPAVPKSAADQGRIPFDLAIKETIEQITGQRGGVIERLPSSATTAQIIEKINEIIDRLQ
jgi:hypothetical protein